MLGILPALLVLYIRRNVQESPGWSHEHEAARTTLNILTRHWRLALYAIALMTAFNFLSHGTQDLYPTFLKIDHGLTPHSVALVVIIANIGAIAGGLSFGTLSQRFGRRRTLIVAALLSLPVLPFWLMSNGIVALALSGFVMQFMVQGCWGLVPAHLNELSPAEARGTFPGVVYQLGNLFASRAAPLQATLAVEYGSYGIALASVAVIAALAIAFFASVGREAKEIDMRVTAPA
jgi:SHS family lactate transporter-like MFS transporter